eukprot:27291-Amorphochlora_amoeboformis.AAC.1
MHGTAGMTVTWRDVTLCHASSKPGHFRLLLVTTACDDLQDSPESPAISSYLEYTCDYASTRYRNILFELRPL